MYEKTFTVDRTLTSRLKSTSANYLKKKIFFATTNNSTDDVTTNTQLKE